MLAAAKEGIAIPRELLIEPVAQEPRQHDPEAEQAPRPGEVPNKAQNRGGLEVGASSLKEDHRLKAIAWQTTPGEKRLPCGRLHGREPQFPQRIMGEKELDAAIAQIADAVEEDDTLV